MAEWIQRCGCAVLGCLMLLALPGAGALAQTQDARDGAAPGGPRPIGPFLDAGFQQDAAPLAFERLQAWVAEEPLVTPLFPDTARQARSSDALRFSALGGLWREGFRQDLQALPEALLDARVAIALSLRTLPEDVRRQLEDMVLARCAGPEEDEPEGPPALAACVRTDLSAVVAGFVRLELGGESLLRPEHKALLRQLWSRELQTVAGWPVSGTRRMVQHLEDYIDAGHGQPPAIPASNPCRAETATARAAEWPGDEADAERRRQALLARMDCEASAFAQPAFLPVLAERLRQEQALLPERPLQSAFGAGSANPTERLLLTMYLRVLMLRVEACIAETTELRCPDLDYDEEEWQEVTAAWEAEVGTALPARLNSLALGQTTLRLTEEMATAASSGQEPGTQLLVLANSISALSAAQGLADEPRMLRLVAAAQLAAVLQETRPSWARVNGVTWNDFVPAVCGRSSTFGWARVAAALRYTGGVPKFNEIVRGFCAELFELALQVERLNARRSGLSTGGGGAASQHGPEAVLATLEQAHHIVLALTARIAATWPEEARAFGLLSPEASRQAPALLRRAAELQAALAAQRHGEAAGLVLALYDESGGQPLPRPVRRLIVLGGGVAGAQDEAALAGAFRNVAVPQAGYRAKRDGTVNLWTLNAYVGLWGGSEQVLSDAVDSDTRTGSAFGLWAPIGLEYAFGTGDSTWSFFLPVIDLGSTASERSPPSQVKIDDVEVGVGTENLKWENLFSPGFALLWGVSASHPTVLGLSLQYTATHRTLETGNGGQPVGTVRAMLIFAFDLPLVVF